MRDSEAGFDLYASLQTMTVYVFAVGGMCWLVADVDLRPGRRRSLRQEMFVPGLMHLLL